MKRLSSEHNGGSKSSHDRKRFKNESELAPRRVVFISGLPDDITEAEVVQLGLPFGRMNNLVLAKKKNQALLEMSDLDSAQAMVEYYSERPPKLGPRPVHVCFSNYEQLKTDSGPINAGAKVALKAADELLDSVDEPHSTLRVIIDNMIYPITLDVLHKVFSKFGQVLRIVTYMKNNQLHAFIEYSNAVVAASAKNSLNGQNIYNGCCTLRVDFSKMGKLTVRFNNDRMRDYTNPNLPSGDGKSGRSDMFAEPSGGMQGIGGRSDMLTGSGDSSLMGSRRNTGFGRDGRPDDDRMRSLGSIMGGNLMGIGGNLAGMVGNMGGMSGNMGGMGGMAGNMDVPLMGGNILAGMAAGNMAGLPGILGAMAGNVGLMGGGMNPAANLGMMGGLMGGLGNLMGSGLMGGLGGIGGIGGMPGMGNIAGMGPMGLMNAGMNSDNNAGMKSDMDRMDRLGSRDRRDSSDDMIRTSGHSRRDDMGRDRERDRDGRGDSRTQRRDEVAYDRDGRGGRNDDRYAGGCVLLVSNLDEKTITPDKLFILFGMYGNVLRVKILFNKKDTALVEFADQMQAETALLNLNRVKWAGRELRIDPSKHTHIQMPRKDLPDAWLTKDFTDSSLQRFRTPNSKNYHHIFPPSATLHLSNIAPNTTERTLVDLFAECGRVRSFKFFQKDKKMALVQMDSVEEGINALIEMHDHELSPKYHLRVSFTNSTIRD